MSGWPVPSEVLSINGEFEQFGIVMANVRVDLIEVVVEALNEVACIEKTLIEVLSWVIAGDRDVLGEEISPSAIPGEFSIEVDREIGAMDFFRCHPKNFRRSKARFTDTFDELIAGGEFEGGVLFEKKIFLRHFSYYLLVLHLQFFYISKDMQEGI